jgi:hypothetical protein
MFFSTGAQPHVSALSLTPTQSQSVSFGGAAQGVLIQNLSAQNGSVLLNGLSGAKMTIPANSSVSFQPGEMYLTSVTIQNNNSSGGSAILVEVIYSV